MGVSIAAELVLGGTLLIPNLRVAAHFSPSVGYVRSKSNLPFGEVQY